MQDVFWQVEYRDEVRSILTPDIVSGRTAWKVMTHIRPESREEADKKAGALARAMPTREFRVREIADEDIPF